MRLIDKDALIKYTLNQILRSIDCNDIARFPTIDAVEVVHGRWIEVPYVYIGLKRYMCDQCADDEYWTNRYLNSKEKYCPNCGAKMDGMNNE